MTSRRRTPIPASGWWEFASDVFISTVSEALRKAKSADLRESGHECGSRFEVAVRISGHGGMVGEGPDGHRDADWFSEPATVVVRAHNLRDALLLAAATPLQEWEGWPAVGDEDD